MKGPKILTFDLEIGPEKSYHYGRFNINIHHNSVIQSHILLSFSAKWVGEDEIIHMSLNDFRRTKKNPYDDSKLAKELYKLIDEADVLVGHNVKAFDIKHANTRFLAAGLRPPSDYKEVDTLGLARRHFKFGSNKLDALAQQLTDLHKLKHEGMMLYVKCMEGTATQEEWEMLKEYNNEDVRITEEIYLLIRPWMKGHPNFALYVDDEDPMCRVCGSKNIVKKGYAVTTVGKYHSYLCNDCGHRPRGKNNLIKRTEVLR